MLRGRRYESYLMTKKPETRVAYRSAVDGQFITKREHDRNPREAVRERIPVPPPPKKGS
jgi:hypothetical protein